MINEKSAKLYCKDDISKIENYEDAVNDSAHSWDCHHRLELTLDGEFANSVKDLKRMNMYFNRPYFELIFLRHGEHTRLHGKSNCPQVLEFRRKGQNSTKGQKWTDEQKKKLKGRTPWNKGKPMSAEQKEKLSKAHKGKSSSRKGIKMSEEQKLKLSIAHKKFVSNMTAEDRKKYYNKRGAF